MDLTNINKLYTPDGRELAKLYDNQGRLIWQAGPSLLWKNPEFVAGTTSLTAKVSVDIARFKAFILVFDKRIATFSLYPVVANPETFVEDGKMVLAISDLINQMFLHMRTVDRPSFDYEITLQISYTATGIMVSPWDVKYPLALTAIYGVEN